MKIEDAIKTLEVEQIDIELRVSAMEQEGIDPTYSRDLREAMKLAIDALKEKLAAEKNEPIPIPAADVVEVVHCRDCAKGFKLREDNSKLNFYRCGHWKNIVRDCDFCSFGERSEP